MDAIQIAFALVELFEKLTRNIPDFDAASITLGRSESALKLGRMLDEHNGAREQLTAACAADPSLAVRLEALAAAAPFVQSLRPVIAPAAAAITLPAAPVVELEASAES
jgi:hypothetical protein